MARRSAFRSALSKKSASSPPVSKSMSSSFPYLLPFLFLQLAAEVNFCVSLCAKNVFNSPRDSAADPSRSNQHAAPLLSHNDTSCSVQSLHTSTHRKLQVPRSESQANPSCSIGPLDSACHSSLCLAAKCHAAQTKTSLPKLCVSTSPATSPPAVQDGLPQTHLPPGIQFKKNPTSVGPRPFPEKRSGLNGETHHSTSSIDH